MTYCVMLFVGASGALLYAPSIAHASISETLDIDATLPSAPLPHFWEQMFGSGRAILSLRDSYRQDLRSVKVVTSLRYVRFHAIFHDEVGVVQRDGHGRLKYNFSYVDQIFDGLLEEGVRPFVEISFMPIALTSSAKSVVEFWYRPNRAPPRDYSEWDDLITHFTTHLVQRYGVREVSQWYFEVWNEPNIDFWGGKPKQRTYFELYAHTSRAIKSVSNELMVGGPATAQAAWVSDFIGFVQRTGLPLDFVSSHVYGNDTGEHVFGTHEYVPRDRMVCRAVKKIHEEIQQSRLPHLPFILSEFNASYANEPNVTDSVFMGPWLASTIRQCAGMVDLMSYWTFSDVFEEQGVVRSPFYGGYGLIAERGIPKPAFNAFLLLHKLGDRQIPVDSNSALATTRANGTIVIALWNYADSEVSTGNGVDSINQQSSTRHFILKVAGTASDAAITIWRLDADHGNALKAFRVMGEPTFPTIEQIRSLKESAQLSEPEKDVLTSGTTEINVPGQGLAVIEISASGVPTSQGPGVSSRTQ